MKSEHEFTAIDLLTGVIGKIYITDLSVLSLKSFLITFQPVDGSDAYMRQFDHISIVGDMIYLTYRPFIVNMRNIKHHDDMIAYKEHINFRIFNFLYVRNCDVSKYSIKLPYIYKSDDIVIPQFFNNKTYAEYQFIYPGPKFLSAKDVIFVRN